MWLTPIEKNAKAPSLMKAKMLLSRHIEKHANHQYECLLRSRPWYCCWWLFWKIQQDRYFMTYHQNATEIIWILLFLNMWCAILLASNICTILAWAKLIGGLLYSSYAWMTYDTTYSSLDNSWYIYSSSMNQVCINSPL